MELQEKPDLADRSEEPKSKFFHPTPVRVGIQVLRSARMGRAVGLGQRPRCAWGGGGRVTAGRLSGPRGPRPVLACVVEDACWADGALLLSLHPPHPLASCLALPGILGERLSELPKSAEVHSSLGPMAWSRFPLRKREAPAPGIARVNWCPPVVLGELAFHRVPPITGRKVPSVSPRLGRF